MTIADAPPPVKRYTIADWEQLPDADSCELVDGVLKVRHVSSKSNWVATQINTDLAIYARARGGVAFGENVELAIDPLRPDDLLYKADGAFVASGRIEGDIPGHGYLRVPPDLVLEVDSLSTDSISALIKVRDYLRLGVRMVWLVYPDAGEIHVYRRDGTIEAVCPGQDLTGGDVLPGFRVPVDSFFRPGVPAATAG